jgi:capsular exopolysaccharide synthesis family protein
MSRIDEALRRAAQEQEPNEADASPEHSEVDGNVNPEVETLSREPFPIEMTNRIAALGSRGARQAAAPTRPPLASADSTFHVTEGSGSTYGGAAHARPAGEADTKTDSGTPRDSLFERIDHKLAEKVVADVNISSISREQYRRLAAVLHDAQTQNKLNVVMIASALSGEGKTLTASNLALTLSESYQKRVLLIDADLRKPTLHEVFRIESMYGLTDGLQASGDTKLTVHQVSTRLSVLPAGRPTTDPMAGLISERMQRLIEEAREAFDWVIIDTPPVVLLPDANLLAAMVDATVLVVRADSTPHKLVRRAIDALGAQRIIGTVLNQATAPPGERYGAYSYYYGSGRQYLEQKDAKSSA